MDLKQQTSKTSVSTFAENSHVFLHTSSVFGNISIVEMQNCMCRFAIPSSSSGLLEICLHTAWWTNMDHVQSVWMVHPHPFPLQQLQIQLSPCLLWNKFDAKFVLSSGWFERHGTEQITCSRGFVMSPLGLIHPRPQGLAAARDR